jgi:diguanylate cyclase (GGDEF)-like protein
MFDKLTNIYNRTYFEDMFYDFQNKAFTHNKKFTLVIMDLNYLKKINDTYGHILGDEALKTFAEGVKKHFNATDVFARYGGDEFIALVDNVNLEHTKQTFEEIISYFEHINIEYNGTLIPIQFSYGIAEAPAESMILDILVKIADERMYLHKKYLKHKNQEDSRFNSIR